MSITKRRIKKRLKGYKNIVIWGTGGLANNAINPWLPKTNIDYIVDINNSKKNFNSFPVYTLDALSRNKPDLHLLMIHLHL